MPIEPYRRVHRYQEALAKPENISNVFLRWNAILPKIDLSIGFNITFRFLMDMFLALNLHFEPTLMEWELPEFGDFITPKPLKIGKLRVGYTKYGEGIVDPPEVNVTNLERLAWNFRYKTTDKSWGIERQFSKQLLFHFQTLREYMTKYDVRDVYADSILEVLSMIEGKLIRSAYVGFSVVDISRVAHKTTILRVGKAVYGKSLVDSTEVMEETTPYSVFQIRDTKDWKTYRILKSIKVYENHVGYAKVNYARVIKPDMRIDPSLVQDLVNRIKEFRERTRPLWQGVFFLQRTQQFHRKGGRHQARLGFMYKSVKEILDKRGIFGFVRGAYQSFARELYYFKYKGHKKWKYWKEILSEEDIIEKYKRMGCDENILREIQRVI